MTIARRAYTAVNYSSGSRNTLAAPAGVANDDVLLCYSMMDGAGWVNSITSPVAFTQVVNQDITNGDTASAHLLKRVASSEPANYNFDSTGGNNVSVIVVAYSGVDTATFIEASSFSNPNSASPPNSPVTVTYPSINTLTDGARVVLFGSVDWNTSSQGGTVGAASGVTQVATLNPAAYSSAWCGEFTQATAGATGTHSHVWTNTGQNGNFLGWAVALKPAGGGGGGGPAPAPIVIGRGPFF